MNECNIVRDLMPLCAEGLGAEDSQEFIWHHIGNCPACARRWHQCKEEVLAPLSFDPEVEKRAIKKALRRDRWKTVFLTLLISIGTIAVFVVFHLYLWGILDPIEVAYASPNGQRILEVVERDAARNHGEGYMIKFQLKGDNGGVNQYSTDWDSFTAHWAGDNDHVLIQLMTVAGKPELRIIDTREQHHNGGTLEIPGMSDDLLPRLTELCMADPDFPAEGGAIQFHFKAWSEDSRLIHLTYSTESGQTGVVSYNYSTDILTLVQ